jgi:DNA-binding PadR family transcriptional regulator
MPDDSSLETLLEQWEGVYKKGLLSFWLLLLLHDRPMYAFEMGEALDEASLGTVSADTKSLYRALRRFEAIGLVQSSWQPSDAGPSRRYYRLTDLGLSLLQHFARRNILLFQHPSIAARLSALMQLHGDTQRSHGEALGG